MRPPAALLAALLLMPLALATPALPYPGIAASGEQPLGIPEPAARSPAPAVVLPAMPGDDVVVPVARNQNEFSIAANPLDPDHLVAGANDYSRGDAWAGVYVSRDGGATWSHDYIPLPAIYTVSGDPAIAFGPDGAVYYAGIAFNRGSTNNGANGIFVSRSLDGGATWTTVLPYTSPSSSPFHDKPFIGVDPASGDVLLSYTHFAGGIITFGKSTDGGLTWTPRKALGTGQFSLPVAGQDGEVFVAWASGGAAKLAVSLDGGATFAVSTPMPLGTGAIPVPFRWFAYPVMEVARGGPHEGRLYLAGPQLVAGAVASDLVVMHSDDAGATWSEPDRLVRPGIQFMPWMAIQPDGTLGIAYMDTILAPHSNQPISLGGTLPTPLVQGLSVKGPDDLAWTTMVTTDVPSLAHATVFWGDYQGLAATSKGFHPAFGDARGALAQPPCGCAAEAPLDFGTMRVAPLP